MSVETSHPSHTPPETTLPHAEYEHDGRLKIVITGLDKNIRDKSAEAAHAKLNEKIAGDGGGGFKSFLKNIFTNLPEAGKDVRAMGRSFRYDNAGRAYYLNKYQTEAEQEIIESGDLLVHEGVFDRDYRAQTTMRFVHEYDDLVHTAAGERRTKLDLETRADGTRDEEGIRLKDTLHNLIKDAADGAYDDADGNFDEDAFNEDKKRAITDAVQQGLTKDHVGPSLMYADNLLQIATHVRAAVSQRRLAGEEVTAEDILKNSDIILGEAKTGARTEIKESAVEKVTNKLSKLPWVNEATVATAVSLAYSVGGWAVKRGIGRVVSAVALPGLAGGVWAALRENAHIKEDMVQHAREAAEGKIDRSRLSGLREKVDGAIYETKSAAELKNQIGMLYDDAGELRVDSPEHFTEAMFMIAEAQARIRLSDERKIDLISFSDVSKVEKERFELDLALAKSKVDMRRLLNDATDDELRALGLGNETIARMRDPDADALNFLMDPQIEGTQGVLAATISRLENGSEEEGEQGMNARDRVANKLRRAEITKAFLKGTLIGGAIGLFVQEGQAALSDSREGILLEGRQPDAPHETALRALWDTVSGNSEHTLNADPNNSMQLVADTKIVLPDGFKIEHTPGSPEATVTGHGVTVEHLKLSPDGSLTNESLQQLQQAGFGVAHEAGTTSHDVVHQVNGESAADFVKNHLDKTTHVTRDYWYDNDTPSVYDKNELGLWDPQHQADGSVKITIGGMTDNGSEHHGQYAHWKELAKEGNLKVALSMSKGTQTQVFMFNIDSHGNAIIPADHPMAGMFSSKGGEFKFNGQYTEVVQVHGVDQNGVTHIRPLATDIGRHTNAFTDTITTKEIGKTNIYTLNFSSVKDVLVPPTVPIYGRRGLAPNPRRTSSPYMNNYNGYVSPEQRNRWGAMRSPRLTSNPETDLNAVTELAWYFGQERRKRGDAYVNGLAERVNNNPELANMPGDTELMINIPVAAAYEMDNIYNTLKLYSTQGAEALRKTQFVLGVNWKEGASQADINRTIAEIRRAQQDFPNMNISMFTDEWSTEFIEEREGRIYGEVINSVYNTSMMAVAMMNSRLGTTTDPLIVTNDADAEAISGNYLERLIAAKNRNPSTDMFIGKMHWGTESFQDNPGFGVVASFFSLVEDRVRDMGRAVPPGTWGGNSAFRVSSLAAVGGVDEQRGAGADGDIGRRIFAARIPEGGVSRRSVAESASGAWLTTSPDRILKAYKDGVPITDAWNNFESGGYTPRPDMSAEGKEDPNTDFPAIKARIEYQLSSMLASGWQLGNNDPEIINAALENIFFRPSGSELWTIAGSYGTLGNPGNIDFKFTPEGEAELKVALSTIYNSIKEGTEMLDEVYARTRQATGSRPVPPVRPAQAQPAQTPKPAAPPTNTPPTTAPGPNIDTQEQLPEAYRRISYLEAGVGTSASDVTVTNVLIDGVTFNGPMRLTQAQNDSYVFDPLDSTGKVISGGLNFTADRTFLSRLIADGALKTGRVARRVNRGTTASATVTPGTTVPPEATTSTVPPPSETPPQPPLSPTEERTRPLLDNLVEGNVVTSNLSIDGRDLSGPMRFSGILDGNYVFNPVNADGTLDRRREDLFIPQAETLRYLRNGSISIPRQT